jgi:putative aldouronate transport system substrate-binding protein
MVNSWLKRIFVLILACVMLVGMFAGCGNTQDSNEGLSAGGEDVSYPVDTKIKLTWYVQKNLELQSSYVTAEESPFHSGLTEMTGIGINWMFPAKGADLTASYNLILQEEKLPHIMSGDAFNSTEATELMNEGLIVDLTDYLPKYAPDYWAYITDPANEVDYKSLLTADGRVYGFGALMEEDFNIAYLGPVIRKDWLEECNLDEPVTLADWENVLVTFKEKYGAVLSFAPSRFNWAGIGSGTGAFAPLTDKYYVDENQKVQFANAQVEWRKMLEVLNRWYDMNLLDKDFATNSDSDVRAKVLRNEVGISFTAMSQMTTWIEDAQAQKTGAEWMGIEYPREAAGVPTKYIYIEKGLRSTTNAAVITTSCSEQEIIAACKLLNYGFTEDGILYWNYGKEGVSYVLDENGQPQFTDVVTSDALGISEACKKYTGTFAAGISIQQRAYVDAKFAKEASEAVEKWITNTEAKKYILPTTAKTTAVAAELNDAKSMISTYVKEMALKFVTGTEELTDANWQKYLNQLESYGLSRVLQIEQDAYDKYLAN